MTDIEHELVHCKEHFTHFGLKKPIATCHSGSPIAGGEYRPSLFDDDTDGSNCRMLRRTHNR